MTIAEVLLKGRLEILWWEFCCLLHDIGKLSDEFIRYRQTWHATHRGFSERDPHDHQWLSRDKLLRRDFPRLDKFFRRPLVEGQGTITVINAVHNHISPRDVFTARLQKADGIDSAYDRNLPLFAYEQTRHRYGLTPPALWGKLPRVYKGNVFGFETPLKPGDLTRARRAFYGELAKKLDLDGGGQTPYLHWDESQYERFKEIRELMLKSWDRAMSDTTRPANDTSLWEHVYSVATIGKALHARALAEEAGCVPADPNGEPFQLWGVGFDCYRVLSHSLKLADVAARRTMLKDAFRAVQKLVEYDYPCGNLVYEDDDQAFFLIAPLGDTSREWLRAEAEERCAAAVQNEVEPAFVHGGPTQDLTGLPELIEEMRKETAVPVRSPARIAAEFRNYWPQENGKQPFHASVCPVCRLRPAKRAPDTICDVCTKRRREAAKARARKQTAYLSEIADGNGRAALLVARIGLRDWLDGSLVRTLLVTPPEGVQATLDALPSLVDFVSLPNFEAWAAERRGRKGYAAMLEEFARVLDELDQAGAKPALTPETRFASLFYGRALTADRKTGALRVADPLGQHGLKASIEGLRRDLPSHPGLPKDIGAGELLNALCAKSPTPSTLLDVWQTTLEFFEDVEGWLPDLLPARGRRKLTLEGPLPEQFHHDGAAFDAKAGAATFEVAAIGAEDSKVWLLGSGPSPAPDSKLTLVSDSSRAQHDTRVLTVEVVDDVFFPFRLVSASPVRLLLFVPAAEVPQVVRHLYDRFLEGFGKVYGRLPIGIEALFFPAHLPMFSVLDAARRAERGLRRLQEDCPRVHDKVDPPESLETRLGDCVSPDYFHPYWILGETEAAEVDFQTVAGPIVHMSRLGDRKVCYQPNLFGAHWLGASASRLGVGAKGAQGNGKPKATLREYLTWTKPVNDEASGMLPVEQFQTSVEGLWNTLVTSGLTDTQLRQVIQVFERHRTAWLKHDPEARGAAHLAACLLPQHLRTIIEPALVDGSLENMARLYLGILKERLHEE